MAIKAILIHGNGGCTAGDFWLPWVERELIALGLEVINQTFPDHIKARARFWLPHLEMLDADENTILIGHSSGAVAAMRYAETHRLLGSILVGVCHTDLGDSFEVTCEPGDLVAVRTALQDAGIDYESAEASFQPSVTVPVDLDGARKVIKLIDALEDSDDVQDVYTNIDIPDDVAAILDEE